MNGNDDHAALVQLGLDYTTFNFQDTSMGGVRPWWRVALGGQSWHQLASARRLELQVLSSRQQAVNAALGSLALVIGRPITSCVAPAVIASAGPITRA